LVKRSYQARVLHPMLASFYEPWILACQGYLMPVTHNFVP
jgi:hypothetical protein